MSSALLCLSLYAAPLQSQLCHVCGHAAHPTQRLQTSTGPRTHVGTACYGCPICMEPTEAVGWRGV